ncbi:hypothetical protein LOK49_LG06G02851 [Camellia lanceoleosa]|uniref:Uncharacterized protein n=1 Tax=Camellia lanceoleosa TaxID=1840588 RepID=A0ACC0HCF0_9ERIC|nr:hypothetical protein LOK49_LG06G02851 [Camellia lanceoleosa]
MLQVKNKIKGVSEDKDGSVTNHHTSTKQHEIMVFDHEFLNNRDSMEWWLGMAISRTQLFPFQITPKLPQDISTYLFSCFQFNNINNQTSSRKPIIVIVVNVYISRNKEEIQEVADDDGSGDSMEENILGMFVREEEPRRRMNQVEAAMKVKRFHGNGSVDDMCSIYLETLKRAEHVLLEKVQALNGTMAYRLANCATLCFTLIPNLSSDHAWACSWPSPKLVAILAYAIINMREHAPSIIFMDEIDSIGSARMESRSGNGDSEVCGPSLELLNQLDGFEASNKIKVLMARNCIDILDQALLRPGRIDRKIEFPNPNEENEKKRKWKMQEKDGKSKKKDFKF